VNELSCRRAPSASALGPHFGWLCGAGHAGRASRAQVGRGTGMNGSGCGLRRPGRRALVGVPSCRRRRSDRSKDAHLRPPRRRP